MIGNRAKTRGGAGRILPTAALALAIALSFVLLGPSGRAEATAAVRIPDLAGYGLIALKDGSTVRTDSLKGRPLFLAFFTPTCPYCREELAALDRVAPKYRGKISLVALAPESSGRELVSTMLGRWGIRNIPGYLDAGNRMFEAFGVTGVPFSVFFDRNGKGIQTFLGLAPMDQVLDLFARYAR